MMHKMSEKQNQEEENMQPDLLDMIDFYDAFAFGTAAPTITTIPVDERPREELYTFEQQSESSKKRRFSYSFEFDEKRFRLEHGDHVIRSKSVSPEDHKPSHRTQEDDFLSNEEAREILANVSAPTLAPPVRHAPAPPPQALRKVSPPTPRTSPTTPSTPATPQTPNENRYLVKMGNKRNRKKHSDERPKKPEDAFMMTYSLKK